MIRSKFHFKIWLPVTHHELPKVCIIEKAAVSYVTFTFFDSLINRDIIQLKNNFPYL
jgi:hypothetical protein